MAKEYRDIESILNNSSDKAKLKNSIDEAILIKKAIKTKNEDFKVIADDAAEKVGIDPKLFKQLVSLYLKNNFAEKQAELSALESAIEMLVMSADNA